MDKLIITDLSKTYDNGVKALVNVSLTIPKGMFGLLGPNGAGKSTFMRTIATLQDPDTGSISLGEIDILQNKNELRKVLGYLPQEFGLYPRLSPVMLLNHLAILKGITNSKERKAIVDSLLQKVNLYDVREQKLGSFSGGMKQRFGIAQALLNKPKLLIVDEPTAGLDPVERNRFYNLLSEIAENTIVILSTHIVDDIKNLCANMAIIDQGQVLLKAKPLEAIETVKGKVWEKYVNKDEIEKYKKHFNVISERFVTGKPVIRVFSENLPGANFHMIEADLEDVYFSQLSKNATTTEAALA
ncbi:ABC transporter ATP-binding protein [Gramella sp. MAR_2010_147]|uniref:ABC transporter ATP-binding protein n=1 Tax=Gramella sp. MAR_2010_147 TaxID=1250205 RepID=UPI00087CFFA1|nr:ABC transporter ATP-binding protein [Gramella sp. MAR_2010_147]SDR93855.1 ABC-type multidrug transport system, ATPase component [Gramella sp. MAR_2010_147]